MSIENNPLVSVLMTCYNRQEYITEAIESVLASTYTNLELIIVDDCSTDKTFFIAKEFSDRDKRIKVFLNKENLGDYPNRNMAASHANGVFLMHCDSDDKLFADGIQKCVMAMLQFPAIPFGMFLPPEKYQGAAFFIESDQAIRQHFFKEPFLCIGPGGTVIRKDFFERIKGYPEMYGPCGDMYFNLKCVSQAPIVLLPFHFLFYRRHDEQEINNSYGYLVNSFAYLRDALNELTFQLKQSEIKWLHKKNKRRFVTNIFKFLLATKNLEKTRTAVKAARFTFRDLLQGVFQ